MNNNNDNNDNTMNNNNNDSTMDKIDSSSGFLFAEAVTSSPAQKNPHGVSSALYKLAARNLREYHGVSSMTALKLEKTVALLNLAPRRLVVQGLAPRRLLQGGKGGPSPLTLAGESSGTGDEDLREAETGAVRDNENLIINNNSSSEDGEGQEEEVGQEDKLFSDDSINNSTYDDNGDSIDYIGGDDTEGGAEGFEADDKGNGKARIPFHAALVAGGINLRPRETRPLLRALGVSPGRLVKLGLVKREAVRAMPGRRGGDPRQRLCAGGHGKRGVGGPRGPAHGPPHADGGGPSSGGWRGSPRPMHGPPLRPAHGAGLHILHLGEESEEEGVSAPQGPLPHGGPGHRGPRRQGGRLQGPPHGPGHRSMPIVRLGRGPPGGGGGQHGHAHLQPPHGHGHGHGGGFLHGEGGGEGGERLHEGARGPGQHGPRRDEEGKGRRARGRRQGPPHGPSHEPFHGPFHEGASGAPPGVMLHPHQGSPSRGGGNIKQRGGRHGGRMGGRRGGGDGGVGGGEMQQWWRSHLAHFDDRHQPQVEAH
ncbi:unnamed protein product [Laminaria digitata]